MQQIQIKKCTNCGYNIKYPLLNDGFAGYSNQYDAFYCPNCYDWLETVCQDPRCEYCKDRPKTAYTGMKQS